VKKLSIGFIESDKKKMKIRKAREQDIDQMVQLNAQVQAVHVDLFPSIFRNPSNEALYEILHEKMAIDVRTNT
jgi:hypothetical protein